MKKKLQFMFTAFAAVALGTSANAQCPAGQGQLDIAVTTDNWGYETYFEIVPDGGTCGTGTIFAGGNTTVGCAGGGAQVASSTDPGAYPNNTTTTENIGCYDLTNCYTLTVVDDWGDDGPSFDIIVDGTTLYSFAMTGGANESFNFCMQQLNYDLTVDGGSKGNYYSMIPQDHAAATTLSFSADMTSAGQMDVTGATVTAVVNDGTTDVHTSASTPVTLTSGASNNVALSPDYTLTSPVATYTVTYTGTITETDEDMNNNVVTSTFDVTDSTLGRVGTVTGALGIGAVLENGKLGQTFNIPVNDAITSISGVHNTPTSGDSVRYGIWDLVGGQPGSEIVVTDAYTFVDADTLNGVMVTLNLPAPLDITAGTDYVVMAYEYNNNMTLGTSGDDYEMGTNWVTWDGNPNGAGVWSNGEDFAFSVNYALYLNFGDVVSVQENTLSTMSVYPNPSKDFVNVQLTEDVNNATVVVYAMDGSIVSTKVVTGSLFTVDVQDFANGIYMVEVRDNNNTGVIKIIKE